MNNQCTLDDFLKDIARHEIKIIRDDGLYRHIRFRQPTSLSYYFDLITWPGHLCYTGDMGTYVFTRIEDMFDFFRDDSDREKIGINPSYWSEKVLSESRFGNGVKEYSEEKFRKRVIEYLDDCEADEELREAVQDEVLFHADNEYHSYAAMYNFSHDNFSFDDFGMCDVFTFHYVWCCYAMVWGILQYDKVKAAMEVTNVNPLH